MIIGYDGGNYNVKTSEGIIFQSKITEEDILFNEGIQLELNGKTYTVGEGEFQTDLNKADKEQFIVLLLSAVALSTKDTDNQIIIGLPVQHYKTNRNKIRSLVMECRINNIKVNDIPRQLIITDCEVFPEAVGAYYSMSEEQKEQLQGKDIVMIDIGGRTTDMCLFKDKAGKRKIENPQTLFTGMINIYDDFIKAVNAKFTLNKELEDAERILKNGLELYGEKQDLSFTKPIIKKHIDKIFKELNINYPIQTEKVILTGGGSYLLQGIFKNKIPNLIILEDSLFANARGFKKVGESIWRAEG